MRALAAVALLVAGTPCLAETPPTVTATSSPTTTTALHHRGSGSLQGVPVGVPGFGVPGEPPREQREDQGVHGIR